MRTGHTFRAGCGSKDFIRFILKESNYYSGNELSGLCLCDEYRLYVGGGALRIEADGYYKIGKLESALRVYFNILGNMKRSLK